MNRRSFLKKLGLVPLVGIPIGSAASKKQSKDKSATTQGHCIWCGSENCVLTDYGQIYFGAGATFRWHRYLCENCHLHTAYVACGKMIFKMDYYDFEQWKDMGKSGFVRAEIC